MQQMTDSGVVASGHHLLLAGSVYLKEDGPYRAAKKRGASDTFGRWRPVGVRMCRSRLEATRPARLRYMILVLSSFFSTHSLRWMIGRLNTRPSKSDGMMNSASVPRQVQKSLP